PESRYAENPILDKLEGDTGDPTLIQKTRKLNEHLAFGEMIQSLYNRIPKLCL
ncbi:hypothetical protein LEP1GSC026_0414, partial [Leptospira interrogans str. 2002000623]